MKAERKVDGENEGWMPSGKKGYAAPELIKAAKGVAPSLTYAADLYSFTAIFFELLKGRAPEENDWVNPRRWRLTSKDGYLNGASELLVNAVNSFLRKGLSKMPANRFQSVADMQKEIQELIALAKKVELVNTPKFNPAYGNFVGREKELQDIDEMLSQNSYAFIYGVAGIGKSELAKKYAEAFRDKYDIVQLVTFDRNLEHTIAAHMKFRNLDEEKYYVLYKDEAEAFLFKDKLKSLMDAGEKTLILLDNYDVADDAKLQEVIRGGCKFIFTTRSRQEQNQYELDSVGEELWLELFKTYFAPRKIEDEDINYINKLIELVDGHTLLVELIAKTMKKSRMPAEALYSAMKRNFDIGGVEEISITKDNQEKEGVLYQHIANLLDCSMVKKTVD